MPKTREVARDTQPNPATNCRPDQEVDKLVGGRVRAARLMLGWTLERLADQVGLTYQQVSNYEAGRSSMRSAALLRFAAALDVPVSFMLGGSRTDDPQVFESAVGRQDALLRMFGQLPDDRHRDAFMKMIQVMLDAAKSQPS